MSAFILPSNENAKSVTNFMAILSGLNDALNACGQGAAKSLELIEQLQSDSNFTVVLTGAQQTIISTCATQLAQAQMTILATLRPS